MIRLFRFALLLVMSAAAALPAVGQTTPLKVSDAWIREPVPGRPSTAAYAILENAGDTEIQITSAITEVAGTVELHEMVRSGDMMKMAPVKHISVPARGRVELKPGGLHVMLFDLRKPVKEGESVPLTFVTSTGARVQTTAAVRRGQVMK